MPRSPKCPQIKTAVRNEPEAVTAEQEMTPHDRKELARFVRRYGRHIVLEAARMIPEPRRRGRPSRGDEPYEEAINIAECLFVWAEEHREEGSTKPIEDALRDLYDVLVCDKKQRQPGHFEKWCRTIKRKRSRVRQEAEAGLARAKAIAEFVAKLKQDAN